WGVATILFAGDNNDLLPQDGSPNGTSTANGWDIDLPKIAGTPTYSQMTWRTNANEEPGKSLFICLANTKRSSGTMLFHYCLNLHVNANGTGNQAKLSSIPKPTYTVWLFDNGKIAGVAQQNNVHTNLHSGGAQFTFLDGHSK